MSAHQAPVNPTERPEVVNLTAEFDHITLQQCWNDVKDDPNFAGMTIEDLADELGLPRPKRHGQTGPRTPEGRAISSQNSRVHGLCSKTVILPGENPEAFNQLVQSFNEEHQPATPTEIALVAEIADQYWRLQRVRRREDELFSLGVAMDDKQLQLCYRYGTKHERAFYKALKTLKELQKQRQSEPRAAASGPPNQQKGSVNRAKIHVNPNPTATTQTRSVFVGQDPVLRADAPSGLGPLPLTHDIRQPLGVPLASIPCARSENK